MDSLENWSFFELVICRKSPLKEYYYEFLKNSVKLYDSEVGVQK